MPTLTEVCTSITETQRQFEEELRVLRAKYVGKGGLVEPILKSLRDLPPGDRAAAGAALNNLVTDIQGHRE